MIQKKICLLGAFSVGKTSLIQRYVNSMFDDRYLTTVGVKIEKKTVDVGGVNAQLMIWDLAGKDEFTEIRTSYVRGTSACIIVVDGTRQSTADASLDIMQQIKDTLGDIPFIFSLNKYDLIDEFEVNEKEFSSRLGADIPLIRTSAKTGNAVEELFSITTQAILDHQPKAA